MPKPGRSNPRKVPRVLLCYLGSNRSILQGIAKFVRDFGPWSLCRMPAIREDRMPEWLTSWEGDGIIGRTTDAASAELMLSTNVPIVDILGGGNRDEIPLVHSDDVAIGRLAAEHLIEREFTHFGFYGDTNTRWARDRGEGFCETVSAAGKTLHRFDGDLDFTGPQAWDHAEEQVIRWLAPLPRPLAVMAVNDDMADRVLNAARRIGIQVPDELAVIGVNDDSATCEVCDPPLSTVMRDFEHQGYLAADLLQRLMSGEPKPSGPVLIRPLGVSTRQSTDVLAIDDPDISGALSFIRRHACDGIGINDVLRAVPLSRSVLQRRFRRVLGRTVNEAIIAQRVKRAQQLLTETDLSLQEIAEIAGFNHPQYLGAVFRKRLGVTPTQFRNQKTTDRDTPLTADPIPSHLTMKMNIAPPRLRANDG